MAYTPSGVSQPIKVATVAFKIIQPPLRFPYDFYS